MGRVLKANYAFKPIAEQALRSNHIIAPQRLNAALDFAANDRNFLMSKAPKFVVQNDGYSERACSYLFVGTEESLRELSESLDRLGKLSNGARIDLQIRRRGSPEIFRTIAFAKCSNEKFAELLTPSLGNRFQKLLGRMLFPGIIFVVFAATIVGIIDIVIGFGRLVLWIAGKV